MSQSADILKHLKSGKTLTQLQALKLFGCLRLAARIEELRLNNRIECEMVQHDDKRYGRYRLVK